MDNAGARGARVLLDAAPIADVLEPPVGAGGGDLLQGVQAEIAAVGKDRGAPRAHVPGVDPRRAWPLAVDAAPEVVLDLDEPVGEPDRATAGVQPAVQVDQAVRVRRGGVRGRVRLQSATRRRRTRPAGCPEHPGGTGRMHPTDVWSSARPPGRDRRGIRCAPRTRCGPAPTARAAGRTPRRGRRASRRRWRGCPSGSRRAP